MWCGGHRGICCFTALNMIWLKQSKYTHPTLCITQINQDQGTIKDISQKKK